MKPSNENYLTELSFKCSKSWNSMAPSENGRHCLDCEKNVLDFSKSTPDEFVSQLDLSVEEQPCGNFYSYQLKNPFGNWKDSIINLYQNSISSTLGKFSFFRPITIFLVFILLVVTGCHRQLRGKIGSSKRCNKPKPPTVRNLE